MNNNTLERLMSRVEKSADGCWEWTGGRWGSGYGRVIWQNKSWVAHRVLYTLLVGPVPDGACLDHLCRNRGCVNPAHLEVVTFQENTRRGTSPAAAHAGKTHCPQGHPYDSKNTVMDRGARLCKACRKARSKAYYQRTKEGHLASQAPKTHCVRGHPYDERNVYVTPAGRKSCRACRREHARERYAREKGRPAQPRTEPGPRPGSGGTLLRLTKGKTTRVDEDIAESLGQLRWHYTNTGYAGRRRGYRMVLLHREIMGAAGTEIVHHLNGDKLDNRRANLVILETQSVHCARTGRERQYRQAPRHVYAVSRSATWRVQISRHGKTHYFGTYKTAQEAERAAQEAVRRLDESATH